jgi:hypothetical protein
LKTNTRNDEIKLVTSLEIIAKIIDSSEKNKLFDEMKLLIENRNWRFQLLFCISLLRLSNKDADNLLELLWKQIEEKKSWILPQLIATATIVDPNFNSRAYELLKQRQQIIDIENKTSKSLMIELCKSDIQSEDKSLIAVEWRDRLFELIRKGKIKTEHNIV